MTDVMLSTAEAIAVLQVDQEQAALLLAGPFAPEGGALNIRQVLGAAVILALPMLRGEDAVRIAISASFEARTTSAQRILGVGWNNGSPIGCWLPGVLAMDLGRPMVVVPADRLLETLQTRLTEHRAAMARLN